MYLSTVGASEGVAAQLHRAVAQLCKAHYHLHSFKYGFGTRHACNPGAPEVDGEFFSISCCDLLLKPLEECEGSCWCCSKHKLSSAAHI